MRMRVLLLGKTSLLGQALIAQAAQDDIEFLQVDESSACWHPAQVVGWLDTLQPDAVLDLSFYHQQFQVLDPAADGLEAERRFAQELIGQCAHRQLLLCRLSSTRVFDGAKGQPYTEKDVLAPVGVHGGLQAELDQLLESQCRRHLLLRFGWVLDSSPKGMLQRLLQQLRSGDSVALAEEWRGTPTPLDDMARVILAALKQMDCGSELYGCYHYASAEVASWISFARTLAQELVHNGQLEREPVVEPVPFETQPAAALEPRNAVLSGRRLLHVFGIKPRTWRFSLTALLGLH